MLRTLLSAVGGYAAMFVIVFVTFTVAFLVMGADGAFQPESWDISTAWIVVSVLLGLVAAYVGGMVCARIDHSGNGPMYLIGLILILSLLEIFLTGDPVDAGIRTSDIGNFEAMKNAQQPGWMLYLNPVIGILGVAFGSGLLGRKR